METSIILFIIGLVVNILGLLLIALTKLGVRNIENKVEHNREMFEQAMSNEVKTREAECERQSDIISRMFESIDETAIEVAKLVEKMTNHITNQRQICKMNHPKQTWLGEERRDEVRP